MGLFILMKKVRAALRSVIESGLIQYFLALNLTVNSIKHFLKRKERRATNKALEIERVPAETFWLLII